MKWFKRVEYNGLLNIDGGEYHITVRKEGDDEFYAVEINNEYMADCEELPTREYLEDIIAQENEITSRITAGGYRKQ